MALSKPTRTDLEHMINSRARSLLVAAHQASEAVADLIENVETYGQEVTSDGVKAFAEQLLEVDAADSQEWADTAVGFKQAVDAICAVVDANASKLRRATKDR